MAIEKQIWTDIILEQPIADDSFLLDSVDMSELVENNTIHLADAGVEPEVFVDNNTYPVGIVSREDVPIELPLHTLDTNNTVVRNVEAVEASYKKLESVTMGHKRALARKSAALAAYNWCPLGDGEFTPVLVTTGAPDANGRKRLTFDDVDTLETRFRDLEVDLSALVLVLNSKHLADLKAEDRKLYREAMKDGKIGNFKLRSYPRLPLFDTTTGQKQAFGSAAGTNSSMASLAYVSTEVMRATGTTEPFVREKDPEARGDILGYQQRFTALPLRNKYIGAIYSGK
jgi:hypothetical protein